MSLSFSPSRLDRSPEGRAIVATSEAGESPNKVRVKQLSDKLGALQDELELEKQSRNDAVELKLKVLDDKLLRAQISEEDKLRPLHEQITKLQEELAAERLSREVMDERKTKRKRAPFFCTLSSDSSGLCSTTYVYGWVVFFLQVFLGGVIAWWSLHLKNPKRLPDNAREMIEKGFTGKIMQAVNTEEEVWCGSRLWHWLVGHAGNYKEREDFVHDIKHLPRALRHVRTYDKFVRANVDANFVMPPRNGSDRWSALLQRRTLFPFLIFSEGDGMKSVIMMSVALGLFSGALSSFFYQVITWQTYMNDPIAFASGNPYDKVGSFSKVLADTGVKIESLIDAFKFFPSFLALGYVGYAISRWRSFQNLAYIIVGTLNTSSLLVGSSLTKPEDEKCKRLAFNTYRYIQVIHLLAYKDLNPWYSLLEMRDFVTLGLLTSDEVEAIVPGENKMVEVVSSWLVKAAFTAQREGYLTSMVKYQQLCGIRGAIMSLHDQFEVGQPNLWAALMKLVCDLLIMMFVVGSSFGSFLYQMGPFQLYVVIFAIFLAVPWLCAQKIVALLANPFTSNHDMFNSDALVATCERTTFLNLRCGWHQVQDNGSASPSTSYSHRTGSKTEVQSTVVETNGFLPELRDAAILPSEILISEQTC